MRKLMRGGKRQMMHEGKPGAMGKVAMPKVPAGKPDGVRIGRALFPPKPAARGA